MPQDPGVDTRPAGSSHQRRNDEGRSGDTGQQGHGHPTVQLGPGGQGSGAVTMVLGELLLMSVVPQASGRCPSPLVTHLVWRPSALSPGHGLEGPPGSRQPPGRTGVPGPPVLSTGLWRGLREGGASLAVPMQPAPRSLVVPGPGWEWGRCSEQEGRVSPGWPDADHRPRSRPHRPPARPRLWHACSSAQPGTSVLSLDVTSPGVCLGTTQSALGTF